MPFDANVNSQNDHIDMTSIEPMGGKNGERHKRKSTEVVSNANYASVSVLLYLGHSTYTDVDTGDANRRKKTNRTIYLLFLSQIVFNINFCIFSLSLSVFTVNHSKRKRFFSIDIYMTRLAFTQTKIWSVVLFKIILTAEYK